MSAGAKDKRTGSKEERKLITRLANQLELLLRPKDGGDLFFRELLFLENSFTKAARLLQLSQKSGVEVHHTFLFCKKLTLATSSLLSWRKSFTTTSA